MIQIRQAHSCDTQAVLDLYRDLCANQAKSAWTPKWVYGLHPSAAMLEDHIENGELFVAQDQAGLQGAMALVSAGDTLQLHLLGLRPACRRTGLSGRMMAFMEEEAARRGLRCLGLDVIAGNLPAEKLYRRHGFVMTGQAHDLSEGGEPLHFHLYEKFIENVVKENESGKPNLD